MNTPITRTLTVQCAPERAFEIFTGRIDAWWPRGHRRFETSTLTMESGVGGRIVERSDSGAEHDFGVVLEWSPPVHLAYSWFPGASGDSTRVDVRFEPRGAETTVHILHAPVAHEDDWDQRAARFARGWDIVLEGLSSYISITEGAD